MMKRLLALLLVGLLSAGSYTFGAVSIPMGGGKAYQSGGGGGGVAPTWTALTANTSNGDANTITLSSVTFSTGDLAVLYFANYASNPTGSNFSTTAFTKTAGTAVLATTNPTEDCVATRAGTLGGSVLYAKILSYAVTTGGTATFQMTTGGGLTGMYLLMGVGRVANADISGSRVNASNFAQSSTGTSATPGTVATGGAGIIFGLLNPGAPFGTQTMDVPTNYTLIGEMENDAQQNYSFVYRSTTTNITDGPTWTIGTSSSWMACDVAYKSSTP